MTRILLTLLSIAIGLLLGACGDGSTQPRQSSIKAVIKTTTLTADKNIAGITLSIRLPKGVAPPLLQDGTADRVATVEITSAGTNLPGATYTPATASTAGQLDISAIVAAGFSVNDTITIHLNVAEGVTPVESDFSLLAFDAFDINGAPVTGLTPTLTTTIH